MSTVHLPEQTRAWSTRELGALIGKTVTILFRPDGDPQRGVVVDAGIGRFGEAWIEFEKGSAVWDRDDVSVTITVED